MLRAFVLDRRSLAVLRIAFGLILLVDLLIRLPDVVVFYTDRGFLPTSYFLPDRVPSLWSFLWFNDDPGWVYLHLGVQLVSALMLIIGYKTRWFLLISWLLILSLDNRNIYVIHGGDKTLRIMMFWSLFLPLGDRWSLDRFLAKQDKPTSDAYLGVPSFAYIIQLCLIYWFAGLWKLNPLWLEQKQGVIEAFKGTFFNTPLAEYLLNFADYLHYLDIVTIGLELGMPFLVFIPYSKVRLTAVILFICLHLSFGTALSLGLFPYISAITWLALIPRVNTFNNPEINRNLLADISATVLLSLVILTNIATLEIPYSWHGFKLDSSINRLLQTIHLDQRWYMFSSIAPYGKLNISSQKDSTKQVIFDQSYYPSHRWRLYYYYLAASEQEKEHIEGRLLADYYCHNQNVDEVTIDFTRLDPLKPSTSYNHIYKCNVNEQK